MSSRLRYSDDEVLIFAGQIADVITGERLGPSSRSNEDEWDRLRNAAADEAEKVIRNWTGNASVPLPYLLTEQMEEAAQRVFSTVVVASPMERKAA